MSQTEQSNSVARNELAPPAMPPSGPAAAVFSLLVLGGGCGGGGSEPTHQGTETDGVITKTALFNLIAIVDGVGSNVQATNATPIELYVIAGGVEPCPSRVASCLVSRSFRIDYEDAFGQSWALDIPATSWTP